MSNSASALPAMDLRRFVQIAGRNKRLAIGLLVLAIIVLLAIFAPLIAPYSPIQQNLKLRLQAPSWGHLLGTDHLGRDTLSRLIYGLRPSLMSGVMAVSLAAVLGTLIGVTAGYAGGVFDAIVSRIFDLLVAWPAIFIAIGLILIVGPGPTSVVIAIALSELPVFGRVVRAVTLSNLNATHVEVAKSMGASGGRVIHRHILPFTINPLIVQFAISAPAAVVAEAALSYLGLGSQPPNPSLGMLVSDAQLYLSHSIYNAVFPIIAIACLVLALTLIADGIQDVLDPRRRRIMR
ncbi:ABC transporter permease [Devosia sp. YIM 151766]|uniref:ABC transporter permease n=1 Tax=Devosia sp. YIM 151766 TaxID=3017325 RepID=UPI00255CC0D4|nr:ABC transporter permease [Devosia sp. YIM 151766]WIY52086.1 ABC transporter permease [Devosia sp. YIM 151766]